jgi:hypothetical protein
MASLLDRVSSRRRLNFSAAVVSTAICKQSRLLPRRHDPTKSALYRVIERSAQISP